MRKQQNKSLPHQEASCYWVAMASLEPEVAATNQTEVHRSAKKIPHPEFQYYDFQIEYHIPT